MLEKTIDVNHCESVANQFERLNEDEKKYVLSKIKLSSILEVALYVSNLYELNANAEEERVRKMRE